MSAVQGSGHEKPSGNKSPAQDDLQQKLEQASAVTTPKAKTLSTPVFVREGNPFCFAGTNNNYLIYRAPETVSDVFSQAKAMSLPVVRTWAFIDRGSLDGAVESVDGDGTKQGVFFRYWDTAKQRVAYNDGPMGLERLDAVLAMAQERGLQLVLVLTNNWSDFGGMDQYASWFSLESHQQFYTDNRARRAYKDYAKKLVERVNTVTGIVYREDPTIFGWELANDPRCTNGGPLDNPEQCDPAVLTQWAGEMSEYLHSIDPNHLVSVGDAGFLNEKGSGHWLRNGTVGVDHKALLALPGVDYGTYQLYPEHWAEESGFGVDWIREHIELARAVGKPTLLSEYGLAVAAMTSSGGVQDRLGDRAARYARWNTAVTSGGGSAALFWQLVGTDQNNSETGYAKDFDGMSVYNRPEDSLAPLLRGVADSWRENAIACEHYGRADEATSTEVRRAAAGFVSTAVATPSVAKPAAPTEK